MNQGLYLIGGIGLGAGLMYLLDPNQGRRRRALLGQRLTGTCHKLEDAAEKTFRDISHRAQGLAAEARSRLSGEAVSDDVLVERIRSRIGRVVSHPHAIHVAAENGRVTLSGPILQREVDDLIACVRSVDGVTDVDNRLEAHAQPGNIPALQGGTTHPGERVNVFETNWAPATRFLAGTAGCALMVNCLARRTPLAALLGTGGFGLFLRALSNVELERLVGFGGGRRAVDVRKTMTIDGPVERIFPLWARYENFPRFMSHVREVRDLGEGRSHWVVDGPAGMPVSWNAVLTRFVPNQIIAWKSEPGSVIANAGIIRFERAPADSTRVDILLSYHPPGGALGHFAATLFGADPKSSMDEDLVRLKSLIEEGSTSAPGKKHVALQDVAKPT